MTREDLKLVPLAAIGLIKGIGEVFVKPFLIEETEKVRHVASAAIHYYTTGPERNTDELADTNRGS